MVDLAVACGCRHHDSGWHGRLHRLPHQHPHHLQAGRPAHLLPHHLLGVPRLDDSIVCLLVSGQSGVLSSQQETGLHFQVSLLVNINVISLSVCQTDHHKRIEDKVLQLSLICILIE